MIRRTITKLRSLSDVDLSGLDDGETLVWNATSGKLVAGTAGGGGGGVTFRTRGSNSEDITADYGDVIYISTLDQAVNVQLPTPALPDKAPITLICIQASNAITVTKSTDFGGTVDVPELQTLYGSVVLVTDASTGWYKVS